MLGKKLGIDLGTTTIRIATRGDGVVLSEPSVLAMRTGRSGNVLAFGTSAAHLDAGEDVGLVRPLGEGAIVDEAAVDMLLSLAVGRVVGRQRIFKPDIVIVVMSTLPGPQRRALLDIATRAGARTVYLLDAPIAAAMGGRLAVEGAEGHLVIDAGGGKTEVCALAEEGTLAGRCLTGGTGSLTAAIAEGYRQAHGVDISLVEVEELLASGAEANPNITPDELVPFLEAYADEIAIALNEVLTEMPAALRRDVNREGVLLTGGAARLRGLDRRLEERSDLHVRIAPEPDLCAVRGAALAVDNIDMLKRNVMYLR